jgi:hypothetical protein
MQRHKLILIALASVAIAAAACSRPEADKPTTSQGAAKKDPSAKIVVPGPSKYHSGPATAKTDASAGNMESEDKPLTLAEEKQRVAKLEKEYLAATELTDKIRAIYDITDPGTPQALDALTRLFRVETDPELKRQLIDALPDIEGEQDRKLAMLTTAILPTQPAEVRQAAIDSMVLLEDRRAISILQSLLNDPVEDIRDDAKDAIEQLKDVVTPP